MRRRPARSLTTVATVSVALMGVAACGSNGGGGAPAGSTAGGAKPSVVTSFYPLEFATEQIAGDQLDVTVLTKPGAEPHDLELGAQDIAAMTRARLVVYAKGFQPAVDEAMQQVDPGTVLDVATAADLTLDSTDHGHDADPGHGADHDQAATSSGSPSANATESSGAEPHDEEHSAADPHFWLDPKRYAAVARVISERLAKDDPAGATAYRANATTFVGKLDALHADFSSGLKACSNRVLVTSHSAFGYLAARYGLEQHGIAGLSPEAEPSAAALAEINDVVRTEGVNTIYQETLVEPQFANTVARSTGATVATLDPVEGLSDKSAGDDYFEVMRSNLRTLQQGQGCT